MKEQLVQYVELLFAGTHDCEDIKQEILQNSLDRYDDLIAEGKVPEAAYRLAIAGIGDISEILGSVPQSLSRGFGPVSKPEETDSPNRKLLRAIGIALYILCPVPLFLFSEMGLDTIGLCGTLAAVAVATAMMILTARQKSKSQTAQQPVPTPRQALSKSIDQILWTVGLALYLILSFTTMAWHITWVIFPLTGAIQELIKAVFDLREAVEHEN